MCWCWSQHSFTDRAWSSSLLRPILRNATRQADAKPTSFRGTEDSGPGHITGTRDLSSLSGSGARMFYGLRQIMLPSLLYHVCFSLIWQDLSLPCICTVPCTTGPRSCLGSLGAFEVEINNQKRPSAVICPELSSDWVAYKPKINKRMNTMGWHSIPTEIRSRILIDFNGAMIWLKGACKSGSLFHHYLDSLKS